MRADISGRVRFFIVNLMVVSLLIVAGGCSSEVVPPLRIGTSLWPGYEPLHLASEINAFDSSRIVLIDSTSPHGSIQGLRNGDLDAVALTLDEVLLLLDQGIELEVVLVCDFSNGGDAILASSGIESMEQLKGMRVGLESSVLGSYLLSRGLERNGMVLDDVERHYIKIGDHKRAMQRGEVDALVTFEPVRSELLSSGSRELFSSREIPHEIVDVLAVRKSYAEQYPQRVEEIIVGWYLALDFISAQPQAAAEIIGRRLHQQPSEVLQGLSTIQFPSRLETLALMRSSEEGEAPLLVTARRLAATMQRQQVLHTQPDVAVMFKPDYLD